MSAPPRHSVSLFALLALSACAPQSLEDLPQPALVVVVTEGGGFCSGVNAVDASGTPWRENGCMERSSGFTPRERLVDDATRAELDALMDTVLALPDDGDCLVPSPSARRYRFVRTGGGEGAGETRQCEPGVAEPARELAGRLEMLSDPDR
ncbi:MAG: hypothetical protein AB8I08_08900 [Sandaracinaceae bacterium]